MTYEPCVARILSEEGGDRQRTINRLLAKHWWPEEAEPAVDACLAALKEPARAQSKRAGTGG
jgi:hypothetical protein